MCGHALDMLFLFYYLLAWRAFFIWEFSFPLLLPFTFCTYFFFLLLIISFLSGTVVKSIIKLKLKLCIALAELNMLLFIFSLEHVCFVKAKLAEN